MAGELVAKLELDAEGRRVIRQALKAAWADAPEDREVIDELLAALKRPRPFLVNRETD